MERGDLDGDAGDGVRGRLGEPGPEAIDTAVSGFNRLGCSPTGTVDGLTFGGERGGCTVTAGA